MSKVALKIQLTLILITSLAIFGCSSSDGGGGTTPPSGAVTITEANAKDVVIDAIGTGNALIDILSGIPVVAEIDRTPTAMDIIDVVRDKVKTFASASGLNTPAGVAFGDTCENPGGTFSGDYTESVVGTTITITGTITFTNCQIQGITLNGTLQFTFVIDENTGDFSDDLQGTISGSDGVDSATLTGLHFTESGNFSTYLYTISNFDYTVDFSDGGGFVVSLIQDILGDLFLMCPTSGVILVDGLPPTQARATVNSDETVTIEFNDGSGWVEVTTPAPGSPFPCTDFFGTI